MYGLVSIFNKKYPPGSVLRCPTTAENKDYDQGGLTSLCLRHITSSPSQTLRRRLVRTTDDGRRGECSTLAAVRHGFIFSHFATRTLDNTVDLHAAKPDIRPKSPDIGSESRFLPTFWTGPITLIISFLVLHFNFLFVPSAFYCTLNTHYRIV